MLLAVDVGNTQTHIGAFEGDELADHWRIATDPSATRDELALRLDGLLGLAGRGLSAVDGAALSSVVPDLVAEYEGLFARNGSVPCLTVGPGVKTGMPIRVESPRELGADRLVNALAAYQRFGRQCVVADFGTAITFDAVSADGEYLGGAIAPGIEISIDALSSRAARLPRIEFAEPASAIGRSTEQSMQAGVVYGYAGMIDGIARRIADELGGGPDFIATGGMAGSIVPFCEAIDEVDDLLTLTGLRLVWNRASDSKEA